MPSSISVLIVMLVFLFGVSFTKTAQKSLQMKWWSANVPYSEKPVGIGRDYKQSDDRDHTLNLYRLYLKRKNPLRDTDLEKQIPGVKPGASWTEVVYTDIPPSELRAGSLTVYGWRKICFRGFLDKVPVDEIQPGLQIPHMVEKRCWKNYLRKVVFVLSYLPPFLFMPLPREKILESLEKIQLAVPERDAEGNEVVIQEPVKDKRGRQRFDENGRPVTRSTVKTRGVMKTHIPFLKYLKDDRELAHVTPVKYQNWIEDQEPGKGRWVWSEKLADRYEIVQLKQNPAIRMVKILPEVQLISKQDPSEVKEMEWSSFVDDLNDGAIDLAKYDVVLKEELRERVFSGRRRTVSDEYEGPLRMLSVSAVREAFQRKEIYRLRQDNMKLNDQVARSQIEKEAEKTELAKLYASRTLDTFGNIPNIILDALEQTMLTGDEKQAIVNALNKQIGMAYGKEKADLMRRVEAYESDVDHWKREAERQRKRAELFESEYPLLGRGEQE